MWSQVRLASNLAKAGSGMRDVSFTRSESRLVSSSTYSKQLEGYDNEWLWFFLTVVWKGLKHAQRDPVHYYKKVFKWQSLWLELTEYSPIFAAPLLRNKNSRWFQGRAQYPLPYAHALMTVDKKKTIKKEEGEKKCPKRKRGFPVYISKHYVTMN